MRDPLSRVIWGRWQVHTHCARVQKGLRRLRRVLVPGRWIPVPPGRAFFTVTNARSSLGKPFGGVMNGSKQRLTPFLGAMDDWLQLDAAFFTRK